MTPPITAEERIAVLETSVTDLKVAFKEDFTEIKDSLSRVLELQRVANGRIGTIETERAVEKELRSRRAHLVGVSMTWLVPLVAAVIGAVTTFVLLH